MASTSKFANTPLRYFLKQMNFYAHKLGMSSTNYDSPHGLQNTSNYSTAEDQAILVKEVMTIDPFRKVVGTSYHECYAIGGRDKINTFYKWENTNKLLDILPGLIGTKTGIT
jgi:D-alanyl-D-alanine carboxypeptidase (penicillin-binding protein 5/6)